MHGRRLNSGRLVLLAVALVAAPAPAHAATTVSLAPMGKVIVQEAHGKYGDYYGPTEIDGYALSLATVDPAVNDVQVKIDQISGAAVVGDATAGVAAGAGCAAGPARAQVTCKPPAGDPYWIVLSELDLRGGDDRFFYAESGSYPWAPGPEFVVHGGPGADRFESEQPQLRADGGPGDDVFRGELSVTYAGTSAPVHVTPDDVADDGVAGEYDDVGRRTVEIFGGDGPDLLGGAGRLHGGPGADRLVGSGSLSGDAGNDQLVSTAPLLTERSSRDGYVLRGGPGDDTLDGGPGHVTLIGGPGADDIHGGGGADIIQLDQQSATRTTLDDLPNDGSANEGDNVHTDVEAVRGGPADDVIIGSPGPDEILVRDYSTRRLRTHDVVMAGGGDDTIALDGRDTADAGPGLDHVEADIGARLTLTDGEFDELTCLNLMARPAFALDQIDLRQNVRGCEPAVEADLITLDLRGRLHVPIVCSGFGETVCVGRVTITRGSRRIGSARVNRVYFYRGVSVLLLRPSLARALRRAAGYPEVRLVFTPDDVRGVVLRDTGSIEATRKRAR